MRVPDPAEWPALNAELTPTSELIPYARNYRTHPEEQVAGVMASIMEWGVTRPILRDEDGTVIAGHCTLRAAMRLGIEQVPTVIAKGWSDAKKRAYVIADNRLAEKAGTDRELLAMELAELGEADFDVELTGYSMDEVADLIEAQRPDSGNDGGGVPPEEFPEAGDDIATEFRCPSCGYEWSGKPK